jgi:hypothetical protein
MIPALLNAMSSRSKRRDDARDKGGDLVFIGPVADATQDLMACGGQLVGCGAERVLVGTRICPDRSDVGAIVGMQIDLKAVQIPPRVNVTCVTPLGEEVASTS